jgi:hypothetical protein
MTTMHELGLCKFDRRSDRAASRGAGEVELVGDDDLMLESIEYQG